MEYIGCILSEVTYGKKGQNIWSEIQFVLVRSHQLIYKEMFVGNFFYIRYVVISIVIFTVMIAIELFYLTQLCSFIGCFFEYSHLFIPIGFQYTLDKV